MFSAFPRPTNLARQLFAKGVWRVICVTTRGERILSVGQRPSTRPVEHKTSLPSFSSLSTPDHREPDLDVRQTIGTSWTLRVETLLWPSRIRRVLDMTFPIHLEEIADVNAHFPLYFSQGSYADTRCYRPVVSTMVK